MSFFVVSTTFVVGIAFAVVMTFAIEEQSEIEAVRTVLGDASLLLSL